LQKARVLNYFVLLDMKWIALFNKYD